MLLGVDLSRLVCGCVCVFWSVQIIYTPIYTSCVLRPHFCDMRLPGSRYQSFLLALSNAKHARYVSDRSTRGVETPRRREVHHGDPV